jgi:hypothetical protein
MVFKKNAWFFTILALLQSFAGRAEKFDDKFCICCLADIQQHLLLYITFAKDNFVKIF